MNGLSTLQRYWLYQAPGLGIVAVLVIAGAHWFAVPIWACATAMGLWIAKDAVLYPFLKSAYEGPQPTGLETMIGSLGTAQEDLMPHGLVKVGAELWRAESGAPVEGGADGSRERLRRHDPSSWPRSRKRRITVVT